MPTHIQAKQIERTIMQFQVIQDGGVENIYCLCTDGSFWRYHHAIDIGCKEGWQPIPSPPPKLVRGGES